MEIADWLRGLSLERYAETFRDNAIEVKVLPELSEADLEKLGVLLGHRKIMLRAIAALAGAAEHGVPRRPPLPVLRRMAEVAGEAERRQLTVMFCDLVGSTPLSARYDPGGSARDRRRLSSLRRRHRRPLWRFCRQVYGRRRADLFRLSRGA